MFDSFAKFVKISNLSSLICVASVFRTKKFFRNGSNISFNANIEVLSSEYYQLFMFIHTFLLTDIDAIEFNTTVWTSRCERSNRIKALVTTATSSLGAKWWYSWATAITTFGKEKCLWKYENIFWSRKDTPKNFCFEAKVSYSAGAIGDQNLMPRILFASIFHHLLRCLHKMVYPFENGWYR